MIINLTTRLSSVEIRQRWARFAAICACPGQMSSEYLANYQRQRRSYALLGGI